MVMKCLKTFSCIQLPQYSHHSLVFLWQIKHLPWVVDDNQSLMNVVMIAILTGSVEPCIVFLKTSILTFMAISWRTPNGFWLLLSLLHNNAVSEQRQPSYLVYLLTDFITIFLSKLWTICSRQTILNNIINGGVWLNIFVAILQNIVCDTLS